MNKFIGIDPSYTNTGIAVIDYEKKEIELVSYGKPIGDKTFFNIVQAVSDRVDHIKEIIDKYKPDKIITETPPPNSNFGSGLFALDTHLVINLLKDYEVWGVAPTYVGHIHGRRKYSKSESVALARNMLIYFENSGFKVYTKGRLSNDMAEALIFAVRLLVRDCECGFTSWFTKTYKGFKDKKEFKLES